LADMRTFYLSGTVIYLTVNRTPGQADSFLYVSGAWSYHSPPSCAQVKKSSSHITRRITGFLGVVNLLIFWTKRNISETGSVSVLRWKGGGASHSVRSVKKSDWDDTVYLYLCHLYVLVPRKVAQAATLPTFIREVSSSNFGRNTNYHD
jgi:hypothetical protein